MYDAIADVPRTATVAGTAQPVAAVSSVSGIPSTSADKSAAAWLKWENKFYKETIARARKCRDFYLGGQAVIDGGYLHQFITEANDSFYERKKRAHYDNVIAGPVHTMCDFIIRSPETRHNAKDGPARGMADSFLKDVDGLGKDIETFMREVLEWKTVEGFGMIFIEPPAGQALGATVDGQATPPAIQSIATLESARSWPRLQYIHKADILDWVLDDDGNLLSLKICSMRARRASVMEDPQMDAVKTYYVWTRGDVGGKAIWTEYSEHGQELSSGAAPFHEIPAVPVYGLRLGPMRGLSLLRDICDIAESGYNIDSKIDDFLHFAATLIIWMQCKGDLADALKNFSFRNSVLHGFPTDVTIAPFAMSVPMAPFEALRSQKDHLIKVAYRNFRLRLNEAGATAEGASGESKKEDWKITNAAISGLAKSIEEPENEAHIFWMKWILPDQARAREVATTIEYPDNFDVTSLDEKLQELEQQQATGFPEAWLAEKMLAIMQNSHEWRGLTEKQRKELEESLRENAETKEAIRAAATLRLMEGGEGEDEGEEKPNDDKMMNDGNPNMEDDGNA